MRIAILSYEDAVPTCVTGPADIWYGMSLMYPALTGSRLKMPIAIEFVSPSGKLLSARPMGSQKQKKLKPGDKYDLIIIPAMLYDKVQAVLDREKPMIQWLQ